jgi:hypothetical protein
MSLFHGIRVLAVGIAMLAVMSVLPESFGNTLSMAQWLVGPGAAAATSDESAGALSMNR